MQGIPQLRDAQSGRGEGQLTLEKAMSEEKLRGHSDPHGRWAGWELVELIPNIAPQSDTSGKQPSEPEQRISD